MGSRAVRSRLASLLCFGAILGCALNACGQVLGKAVVRAVRGSHTEFTRNGEGWFKTKVGLILRQGASIRTGAETTVDLFLGRNGRMIRIPPNCEVVFNTLTWEPRLTDKKIIVDTVIVVTKGRILFNAGKLIQESRFEIRMPNETIRIRGKPDSVKPPLANAARSDQTLS